MKILRAKSVFLAVLFLLGRKTKKKIFEAFQNSSLKRQRVKTGIYKKLNKAFLKWFTTCAVTTFQSMVLFFWRKLMNLLRPSIKMILQHRTDGWEAGRKGKWYFPWVLICSSNQNNVRWITFFIFSLDMGLFSKRPLRIQKRLLKKWLHLGRRQPYQ